jgi:PncC family amidohydrolase
MATSIEQKIGNLLLEKGLKLCLAESCTGGLIANKITNVPGSSEYFVSGIVAYSYEAKELLLGVKKQTLLDHGAVSRETVLEMAAGARNSMVPSFTLNQLVGVAVSGIAGPGGGMPGKPVGLVWIGLSTPTGNWAYQYIGNGNRIENKRFSARKALSLLVEYLKGYEKPNY